MTSASPRLQESEDRWVGLGEASRLLGVNESSLRRWADAGAVRTFRTPGGHRRFSLADLERLIDQRSSDDGAPLELDDEARAQIRHRLDGEATPPPWMQSLTPAQRAELAALGRETVRLVEASVAAHDIDGDAGAAAAVGGRYAALLREAGVGLAQAVNAFAYFRAGMDQAVRAAARKHGLSADAASGVWQLVAALEDRILVGLAAEYERAPEPKETS